MQPFAVEGGCSGCVHPSKGTIGSHSEKMGREPALLLENQVTFYAIHGASQRFGGKK